MWRSFSIIWGDIFCTFLEFIHLFFPHAPAKPPTWEDSVPLKAIQSLRRPVLKAYESLEFFTDLTGRPRHTGFPELIMLFRPSLPLTLTWLQLIVETYILSESKGTERRRNPSGVGRLKCFSLFNKESWSTSFYLFSPSMYFFHDIERMLFGSWFF